MKPNVSILNYLVVSNAHDRQVKACVGKSYRSNKIEPTSSNSSSFKKVPCI